MTVGRDLKSYTPHKWINISNDPAKLKNNIESGIKKWVIIKDVCLNHPTGNELITDEEKEIFSEIIIFCGLCRSFRSNSTPLHCDRCPLFDCNKSCYERDDYKKIFNLLMYNSEKDVLSSKDDVKLILDYTNDLILYLEEFLRYIECAG